MSVLAITRLRLHRVSQLPAFLADNEKVVRQIVVSDGFIRGKLLAEPSLAMWTATMWDAEDDLRQFYLSGHHHRLMRAISDFACEAVVTHFPCSDEQLPTWTSAYDSLVSRGRFSKMLAHPSDDHRRGIIKPPKLTLLTRPLKAKHLVRH